MINKFIFDPNNKPTTHVKTQILDFLFEHLDQYGDAREDINNCLNYALKETESFGGKIFAIFEEDKVIGCSVINHTGMKGYIPENILVYIAIHQSHRGEGLGSKLMSMITENLEGDIALHVEANNPAKFLYEKFGFTNPYLEMRLKR
jgi:ribosomal protein S18 acetylase RimI-like enzyme